MPDAITSLTATELLDAYARRTLDPVEVVEATLTRIEQVEPAVNAFVTVTEARAHADARAASAAWAAGTAGSICGVPYSLKDLVVTRDIPTGRGSLVWSMEDAPYDAPVAERLQAAGGVLLGKTTTPELGWKGDSGNRRNGPCHNPWQRGRTAGGSSGGSAAAAMARCGPLHQGSDGAGSVRIPAGFCGAVGLKPTYGLIAQYPASAVETVSHIGPITRTVPDCALMLDVMAGVDERDRTSLTPPARRTWRRSAGLSTGSGSRTAPISATPTSRRASPGTWRRPSRRSATSATTSRRRRSASTTRGGSSRRSGRRAWRRSTPTVSTRCATRSIRASSP